MSDLPQDHLFIIYALIALMGITVIGVLILSLLYRTEKIEKEISKIKKTRFRRRSIQFLAVGMAIPAMIILGILGLLQDQTIATLFGAFFGYVLSGLSDEEKDG